MHLFFYFFLFFYYSNLEKKCKDAKGVIRNGKGQNTTHKTKE